MRLRIFQITESLEVGGAERVIATLSNELCARHDVSIVCLKRVGALATTLDPRIKIHCLDKREGQDPGAWLRLQRLLRSSAPDVVHSHDWGVYLDAMLAAGLAGVPAMIHTVHGHYMWLGNGRIAALKRKLRHLIERRAAQMYGQIVCVSDALRLHVEHETGIPATDLKTLMNGVKVSADAPSQRFGDDGLVRCIAVGRLAAVKNFPLLLRAFAQAVPKQSRLRLAIVGDGPEKQSLQNLVNSLGLQQNVELLGYRSDIEELLRGADVFVISSLSEGIPMAVLEAMASARPVIATNVGGLPAMVESGVTGLLVESGDEEAFAAALIQMAERPETARQMGMAGHARALQGFSVQAMVAGYEQLYATKASRSARGGE